MSQNITEVRIQIVRHDGSGRSTVIDVACGPGTPGTARMRWSGTTLRLTIDGVRGVEVSGPALQDLVQT